MTDVEIAALRKIVVEIEQSIKESKTAGDGENEASWSSQSGILISRHDAELMVNALTESRNRVITESIKLSLDDEARKMKSIYPQHDKLIGKILLRNKMIIDELASESASSESAEIERLQGIIERANELTYLFYGEDKKNNDIRQVLSEAKTGGIQ